MPAMSSPLDRLDDLLLTRAIEGLSDTEQRELDQLLEQAPEFDAGRYERSAALVSLAVHGSGASLPPRLQASLESRARRELSDDI
jgi:hypothetical protein